MKAKTLQKDPVQHAELEQVVAGVLAVVDRHKKLGSAISHQNALHLTAEDRVKSLSQELNDREIELALAYDDPDLSTKEADVVQLRGELDRAHDVVASAKRAVNALYAKSQGISDEVAHALESLRAHARELAANQADEVSIEIRDASKALAIAVGKARGIGMGDIRPLTNFLDFVCVPDPRDVFRYWTEEIGFRAGGKSLIDADAPGVEEARQVIAASWKPLQEAAAALRACQPFKPAPPAPTPYVRKGYTVSDGTGEPVYVEPERLLQGFEAYHARGPQPYEIKGDADGHRTKQAAARRAAGANVDVAGAETRQWLEQVERDQAAQ